MSLNVETNVLAIVKVAGGTNSIGSFFTRPGRSIVVAHQPAGQCGSTVAVSVSSAKRVYNKAPESQPGLPPAPAGDDNLKTLLTSEYGCVLPPKPLAKRQLRH